jgi:hypothetical protein
LLEELRHTHSVKVLSAVKGPVTPLTAGKSCGVP